MSSGTSALLGLALGAGGGFLVWHLTKKEKKKPGGASSAPATPMAPTSAAPMATAPPKPSPPAPPTTTWPCSLKLDAKGLTANGERVTVDAAVTRCKQAGRAELAVTNDAPAAIHAQLAAGMFNAHVPLTTRAA